MSLRESGNFPPTPISLWRAVKRAEGPTCLGNTASGLLGLLHPDARSNLSQCTEQGIHIGNWNVPMFWTTNVHNKVMEFLFVIVMPRKERINSC